MLFVVSSFSEYGSNFKEWVDYTAIKPTGTSDFSFNKITADELKVIADGGYFVRRHIDGMQYVLTCDGTDEATFREVYANIK